VLVIASERRSMIVCEMRWFRARSSHACATLALACALAAAPLGTAPVTAAAVPDAHAARTDAICSGPGSANVACRFSTPSGDVRCIWTPKPSSVACVLRASGRAYRLRASGHAKKLRLRLARRGETLPLDQQIVFPQSLSCHDTRRSMTCNQDFATGAFTLAPRGSHSS
jgi:hypothetical protein